MEKGYAKDIEALYPDNSTGVSEKLFVFTGAAAVLGLVVAFNQNISRNSEPVLEDTLESHVAQRPPSVEKTKKEKEIKEVYDRIKKNFEEIETMVTYLPHQEAIQRFNTQNSLMKRTIPSVTVGGKVFKLEVESLDCYYGVTFRGECEQAYTSRPYKAPFRVILSNAEVQAIYQMLGGQADLYIYDKAHPQTDQISINHFVSKFGLRPIPNWWNIMVAPNFTAFLKLRTFEGEEHQFLDSKLGDLHAALKVPYDAQKARQAVWNGSVKHKI